MVIVFASPEKEKTFYELLREMIPRPFIIHLLNKNPSPEKISLFNKDEPLNNNIFVGTNVPDISYNELACLFMGSVNIGLFLVRVIRTPNMEDMINSPIKFIQKDGRGNSDVKPIHFDDDYTHFNNDFETFNTVLFSGIDATMGALTYINLTMPALTEIELHLYENNQPRKVYFGN